MNQDGTETKTVVTPYGDMDMEVVSCTSCGNEVAKRDAVRFAVGDAEETAMEVTFSQGGATVGWACEYCRSEGPIDIPDAPRLMDQRWGFFPRLIAFFLLSWILIPLSFLSGYTERGQSDFDEAVVIVTLFWWTVAGVAVASFAGLSFAIPL